MVLVFKSGASYNGLRKLALNIFVSISTLGNTQQVLKILLDNDLMPLLCGQLHSHDNNNDTIFEVSFPTFESVINVYLHKFNLVFRLNFHLDGS